MLALPIMWDWKWFLCRTAKDSILLSQFIQAFEQQCIAFSLTFDCGSFGFLAVSSHSTKQKAIFNRLFFRRIKMYHLNWPEILQCQLSINKLIIIFQNNEEQMHSVSYSIDVAHKFTCIQWTNITIKSEEKRLSFEKMFDGTSTWQFEHRDNKLFKPGMKKKLFEKHETGGLRLEPMKMLFCAHQTMMATW